MGWVILAALLWLLANIAFELWRVGGLDNTPLADLINREGPYKDER